MKFSPFVHNKNVGLFIAWIEILFQRMSLAHSTRFLQQYWETASHASYSSSQHTIAVTDNVGLERHVVFHHKWYDHALFMWYCHAQWNWSWSASYYSRKFDDLFKNYFSRFKCYLMQFQSRNVKFNDYSRWNSIHTSAPQIAVKLAIVSWI